jgi:hypothetical protein
VVAAAPSGASRRALLGRAGAGLALGVGLGVAGCGSSGTLPAKRISPAQRRLDLELLNHLIDLEHQGIAAYTAGIPLLSGRIERVAKHFLGDELAHAGELFLLIKRQHGKPNRARSSYELGHPRSRAEVLQLFHHVERGQINAYLQAIPQVAPGGTRSALAAILGSDAQHVALVRQALGEPALAGPLVTGAE